jgi:hypothetical protein
VLPRSAPTTARPTSSRRSADNDLVEDADVGLPVRDGVVTVPPYFMQRIPSTTCRKEEMAAVNAVAAVCD